MRSPLGNHRPSGTSKEWKVAVVFLVLLLILSISPLRRAARGGVVALVAPVWDLRMSVESGASPLFRGLFDTIGVAKENQDLRTEITALRAEYWKHEAIREERDALRGYFHRASSTEYVALAYVLAVPNRAPYDTLLLDVGRDAGLFPGAVITTDGGFAIGIVRDVFPSHSVAELHSSPGLSQDVIIGGERIPSVAHGIGGGNYRIDLPKNATVKEGDPVVFAGTIDRFLGVVEQISVDEKTGITTLFLRLPVNMTELRWVFVDLAPMEESSLLLP